MLSRFTIGVALCLGLLGLSGCGRLSFEPKPLADAGADTGQMDAGMDSGPDAMIDARVDAGSDGALDAQDVDAADAADDAADDAARDAEVDSGPPPRDLDYCNEIPPLRRAVVLDGVLEPGLLARPITPVGWTTAGMAPADQPSAYAVAWQADALYFYFEVTDPTRIPPTPSDPTWLGDGLEIYVDADGLFPSAPAYDVPGAIQVTFVAPSDDVTPVARGERYQDTMLVGPWTSTNFRVFPTATGYTAEALIVATDLELTTWELMEGVRVGINVGVNVSVESTELDIDGGAPIYPRLGQYFLRVSDQPDTCNGAPFCQPLAFCTPVLIE